MVAVYPVAPESARGDRLLSCDKPERRRRTNVEGNPPRVDAVGADVAGRSVADRWEPRRGPEGRPPTGARSAQATAGLGAIAEGEQAVRIDLGGGHGLHVPAPGRLIDEAGPRRHRDTRGRFAEQAQLEEFPERAPPRHAARFGRVLTGQPPKLGRPVRGVQV